jgi:putative PEP-CTERM system TPR-repeat lipoprotein
LLSQVRTKVRSVKYSSFSVAIVCAVALLNACRTDPAVGARKHREAGDRQAAAGKYAEAVIEYKSALLYDARAGEVRAKLADAYMKTGDVGNAAGEYIRAADLLPDDVSLQLQAGSLLLLGGRFDDAKARAEKILNKNPKNVDAQLLSANAQAGMRNVDGAVAQIEEAIRIDPERSGTYSNLGALELGRGRRDAAERAFLKAVELRPNAVEPHLALANFYWLTERRDAAERSLKRALEIDPRNALANRVLANFYIATNRRDQAERPLKTVYEVTKTSAAAFALAEFYIATSNDAAATSILQQLTSDPRAAVTANVRLATLEHKAGRREESYKKLDAVLASDKGNLQALLVKSTLLLSDGKANDALAGAKFATERHPDSAPAFFTLGRIEAALRQPDQAIAAFQEVIRLNPRATEAKIALGQLHLAQGRPDATVGLATEALASEPQNGNAELLYIRGLLAQGEINRAENELKKLVARFPESAPVRTQMGMLLGRKGERQAARAEFDRALKIDPNSLEATTGLVALDLAARDFSSARNRVDARLASSTPNAPLLTLAARTYAAGGDTAAAESFLRRALDVDSSYLSAYGALGQLYIQQRKLSQARAEFEALAARSSKPVAALTMAGVILQAEGDDEGARQRFERALQFDPEAAVAANNLAWMYAEKGGNLDVALHLAQTAQKRLPDVPEVNDTLGFIYVKKNLAPLAISSLKVSAEKDPSNALYHYHLGLAYASAGDKTHAKQSLTRALALKPDFDGAQDAKDKLSSLDLQ